MATIRRETFIPFGSPLPEKKEERAKFIPLEDSFPETERATFIPFQPGMEGRFTSYEAIEDSIFVLPCRKPN